MGPLGARFLLGRDAGPRRAQRAGVAGGNSLDSLNKILSASQLSAVDRSIYLSIRAFQLSRLGREAESQKDITEMGKVLPGNWQIVLSSTMPGLAGSGDRAAALRTLDSALQRKPGDPSLTMAQAQVYMQIADFSRALGLLDAALAAAQNPRRAAFGPVLSRPRQLQPRQLPAGHRGFQRDPGGPSQFQVEAGTAPVALRGAGRAAKRDARTALAREAGAESLNEWPGPIIRYLIGKGTAGELEVAAESDDAAKRANGKCPAAFFMGVDAVRKGEKQRAREQFQLAQARCLPPPSSTGPRRAS